MPRGSGGGGTVPRGVPHRGSLEDVGKVWPRIRAVAEENDCVRDTLEVVNAAPSAKVRVLYALHRCGDAQFRVVLTM